ncbi:MAG: Sip1-related alpha-galactosidase, partial [Verrucomicrobia bacterium]|nr:Sip1-related alpha-galactosidase [Verrucomicrobiota bacterium]
MKSYPHTFRGDGGVHVIERLRRRPDTTGVLMQYRVSVPAFERASYFAAFQKYDPVNPAYESWPETANRLQPLAITNFSNLKRGGQFLILKLTGGHYLVLLPLAGCETLTWFTSHADDLVLNLGTLGTAAAQGDFPLLAWSRDADPYRACRQAWKLALDHPLIAHSTRFRSEKSYPDIFRYLGWCSWEEYKREISEKIILRDMRSLEQAPVPVRYVLVDDGHLDHERNSLLRFSPNDKFPHGWSRILSRRRVDGIEWVGLWLNFNGYWGAVSLKHQLPGMDEHLMPDIHNLRLLPRPGKLHSHAFYDAMI